MAERLPPHHPRVYRRNGYDCCRDPVMNLLRRLTPEERVRQSVVAWLIEKKRWPSDCIETEYNFRRDGLGRGRADITLVRPATRDERTRRGAERIFVAVIECKKAGDALADHVLDQGFEYAENIGVDHVAVTNGEDLFTWSWEQTKRRWEQKLKFPTYQQALRGERLPADLQPKPFVRPSWRELNDPAFLRRALRGYRQQFVCDKAPDWVKKHAFDLWSLFRSSASVARLPWRDHGIRVLEDWGCGLKEFGNSSGGSYPGLYRTFLVDEGAGTPPRSVHFSLFSVERAGAKSVEAVRTSFVVAVSDEQRRHNSLQLWVERWWNQSGVFIELTHDGRLAFGRGGGLPRETVLARVAKEAPTLMRNGLVFLGRFSTSQQIDWSAARDMILRLSRYALVRDRVREEARDAVAAR